MEKCTEKKNSNKRLNVTLIFSSVNKNIFIFYFILVFCQPPIKIRTPFDIFMWRNVELYLNEKYMYQQNVSRYHNEFVFAASIRPRFKANFRNPKLLVSSAKSKLEN